MEVKVETITKFLEDEFIGDNEGFNEERYWTKKEKFNFNWEEEEED